MNKHLLSLSLLLMACGSAMAAGLVVDRETSSVSVDVKASPPHEFTCDLQLFDADIDVDPATGSVNSALFSFQLTDLETHNKKRNKKMHNWMDVETFNTICWTMSSVEETEGGLIARGQMMMHGVERQVDIPFTLSETNGRYSLDGAADFNYMEFDLPKIRLFLFTVKPDLHVQFSLQGTLEAAE